MTHMMAKQQQLAVRDTNHAYLESRANAVDAVQGTIAELGNIFQVRGRVKVRVTGRGRGRGRGRVQGTIAELGNIFQELCRTLNLTRANPHPHPHPHQS